MKLEELQALERDYAIATYVRSPVAVRPRLRLPAVG